uniref:Periphilin 1 n=1 Tax=Poecilia formosa TaxID=48698 RepID=A0A096M9E2_POEFO
MTYRRDRSIREVYEDRFMQERPGTYPRAAGAVERRGPFGRPEDEYGRGGYEYEGGPRFYPNGGGPRGFHDDQRGYPVEGHHFPERRAIPPARREDFPYRVPREDPHAGRSLEFGARVPPPPSVRSQGVYPAARSLPESGEDTLVQAIRNLDRGEDRDPYRRKAALFPPLRERSPVRREVARSPHSRSGSSVSSRGYSPDRAKNLPFSTQQGKNLDGPESHTGVSEHLWGALFPQSGHDVLGLYTNSRYEETYTESKIIDKIPGLSREGSPQSATSNKEESNPPEAEKEEPIVTPVTEDSKKSTENLEERRTMAIAAKAKEIEKTGEIHLDLEEQRDACMSSSEPSPGRTLPSREPPGECPRRHQRGFRRRLRVV